MKTLYMKLSNSVGWGDRIFALIINLMFAKLNNAEIIINWTNDLIYGTPNTDTFAMYFHLENINYHIDVIPDYNICTDYNIDDWSKPVLLPDYTNPFILDKIIQQYYSTHIIQCRQPYYINKFINDHIYLKCIKDDVLPFVEKNNISSIVGCHIRYSNNVLRKRYINELIQTIVDVKKYLIDRDQIFFCCDGQDGYNYALNAIPHDSILEYNKNIPFINFDNIIATAHQHKKQTLDKIMFGKEALIEMVILSYCNPIFYSKHSSFGYLSTCLHGVTLI